MCTSFSYYLLTVDREDYLKFISRTLLCKIHCHSPRTAITVPRSFIIFRCSTTGNNYFPFLTRVGGAGGTSAEGETGKKKAFTLEHKKVIICDNMTKTLLGFLRVTNT